MSVKQPKIIMTDTPRLCCSADGVHAHLRSSVRPVESMLQAEVAKWKRRDSQKLRNLPGLMQLLQAKERPEADQPEVIAWQHDSCQLGMLCVLGAGVCGAKGIQMSMAKWTHAPFCNVHFYTAWLCWLAACSPPNSHLSESVAVLVFRMIAEHCHQFVLHCLLQSLATLQCLLPAYLLVDVYQEHEQVRKLLGMTG